ncbi:MAG TPA: hypothetical protein VF668_20250 [Pyrinomonadaceae bacterium]|jgi:hypothetical protein
MAEKSGDCYIDVWRDADFRGETLRIYGPAEHPTLGFVRGDWGDDIGSLRVGPNAFVMAYHRRDFRDRLVTFGPNEEVADLGAFKSDDEIESLKVIDSLRIFDRVGYRPAEPPEAGPAAAGSRHNPDKG